MMSCPLCGEHCTCSYAPPKGVRQERTSILIDSEDCDFSEQQFEASLASPSSRQEARAEVEKRDEAWSLVASVAPMTVPEETNPVDDTPHWREEVTSRVEKYRARRKRPPRQGSLSLDFERAVNRAVAGIESPASESSVVSLQSSGENSACAEEVPQTLSAANEPCDYPPEDRQLTTDDVQPTDDCNVIEFPGPPLVVMPPSSEELAEPIIDKPRILDAPEAVETAQAPLAGIRLEPEEQVSAVQFELPLAVADMSQRAFAGLVDALLVALASGLFLLIVLRSEATLPPGKGGAILLLAAPILFWAVYEYLFLVHAGTTPGMQIAHLRLVTFDGEPVQRRVRRGRVFATVLSCLSLGLGLLWALLDEDTLCWHDRISRTYVVSSSNP